MTDPRTGPRTADGAALPGATRATYAEACQRIGEVEVQRLREAVTQREAELAQLGDRLRVVSREHHRTRQRLTEAERTVASEQLRFERDFDALVALPHVGRIDVDGGASASSPIHSTSSTTGGVSAWASSRSTSTSSAAST